MAKFKGIKCDECGKEYVLFAPSCDRGIAQFARNEGWKLGKKDLCPECNPKKVK